MNDLAAALRELAQPLSFGEPVKVAVDRAARRAGLSYWRTYDLWYGRVRRVEPAELKAIDEALAKRREEAARHELHDLKIRIARLEALFQDSPR